MGIDVKEWAQRWVNEQEGRPNPGIFDTTKIRFMADLIRAVIADEAANLPGKTICTYPVVPEGVADDGRDCSHGIPRWIRTIAYRHTSAGVDGLELSKDILAGVAEATADKDAEIAKLKSSIVAMSDSARQIADKDRRIAELEAIVADRTDMVKCVSDANSGLARHRDALKSQLAAVTAEVERLTKERTEVVRTLSELFKICAPQCTPLDYPMGLISQIDNYISGLIDERDRLRKRALPDGWEMSGSMIKRQDEIERLTKDNTQLRAENARLSRPVSGSPEWTLAGQYIPDVPVVSYETLKIERNAREAAETGRDELREVVKVRFLHRGEHLINEERVVKISDAELDAVLAAFRAEKAKVGT